VGYDILQDGCPVFQLKAAKSRLIVIGNFYNIGDPKSYNLFYIDSVSACHVNYIDSTMFANNGGFGCCEVINDSLIVGGQFDKLDTITANSVGAITQYAHNSNCSYVGIKENSFAAGFIKVYPNPTKDKLNIEFTTSETRDIELSLINTLGEKIYSSINVKEREEIDLSALVPGFYFLNITRFDGKKVVKIIKE